MIRVVFIRHGEAASQGAQGDHSRKLTEAGKEKIAQLALTLKGGKLDPEYILTSDSSRTLETCDILREKFPSSKVSALKELYLASFDDLIVALSDIELKSGTVFLIGHNPGWSEIATQLTRAPVGLSPGAFCSCLYEGEKSLAAAITEIGAWRRESF